MLDIKAELGLGGDRNWPHLSLNDWETYWVSVNVPGVPNAGNSIEGWDHIAILRALPVLIEHEVLVGFKNGDNIQRLRVPMPITSDGMFGMRTGPGDVEFGVLSANLTKRLNNLTLVCVAPFTDPAWLDLPII